VQLDNTIELEAGESVSVSNALSMGLETGADFVTSADTYIDQSNPTSNYGTATSLSLKNQAGQYAYALLQFSFSGLPTANLVSATFYFTVSSFQNTPNTVVTAKIVTSSWAEGSVTYNTAPTVGSSIGDVTISSAAQYSIDITTQVQNWLNGTDTNYGFRLEVGGSLADQIYSKDYATASSRPYLILVYDTSKVFKSSALTSGNTNRYLGFCITTASAGNNTIIQVIGQYNGLSSLTPGSVYYLSDTRGTISTSPGTSTKKVGLATTSTTSLILNS
jgi:hypothetical protein